MFMKKSSLLVLACVTLAMSACSAKKSEVETVHREGQPDYYRVPDKDAEKVGDTALVAKDTLSDWFYIAGGKLVGGYTLRVLHAWMSAGGKKDFDSHVGFKID